MGHMDFQNLNKELVIDFMAKIKLEIYSDWNENNIYTYYIMIWLKKKLLTIIQ